MKNVVRTADCGNSPKNKAVEDFAVAMETRDADFLATVLAEGATWEHGEGSVVGADAILEAVRGMSVPTTVRVDHVTSHGKVGAANGKATHGKKQRRFCYVIEFTSVKYSTIRRVESYAD